MFYVLMLPIWFWLILTFSNCWSSGSAQIRALLVLMGVNALAVSVCVWEVLRLLA